MLDVIAAMGVSHVPEGRGIFANLTVSDNLELGAYLRKDKVQQSEYERIFALFPVLKERIKQSAGRPGTRRRGRTWSSFRRTRRARRMKTA